MLVAWDKNDKRIHIKDTVSREHYFCPYCGAPLITKKGTVRQHHFAHSASHPCRDSWMLSKSYDISPWHNNWQECYPADNQEIRLELGENLHRADVLTGRTVVEFQKSPLQVNAFEERNSFYCNLGYKLIWLFDLTSLMENGDIRCEEVESQLKFFWRNPKKAFNSYDVRHGAIDLFFQLSNDDNACIVRVTDVSEDGFESFSAPKWMSKTEFLEYTGLRDGVCPPPDRDDLEKNESYQKFKETYHITLSKEQERALQAVDGHNLLLAVPGSGKTTVLVDRLGFMVLEKKISPSRILALTYGKEAAEEMKQRFIRKFGPVGEQITFKTINGFALSIYTDFCKSKRHSKRKLAQDTGLHRNCRTVYSAFHPGEYAPESEVSVLQTGISYVKNNMLDETQISQMDTDFPHFSEMYHAYQQMLDQPDADNQKSMDFDDQLQYAHWILTHRPRTAAYWKNRYPYICVDEAQDTSRIQHEIIRLLAEDGNLFMVGDEDQCIYGFRSADPAALLNFRTDYRNPFILRMERNYRSTPQIVETAQKFISKNRGRYEKHMTSQREDGPPVTLIPVATQEEQYQKVLEIARTAKQETAFLYRDNESCVVPVDLFLRNNVAFSLKKPEKNFFRNRIVLDISAFFRLSMNPYDPEPFRRVYNKKILYLNKESMEEVIGRCSREHLTIMDSLDAQVSLHGDILGLESFRTLLKTIAGQSSYDAANSILNSEYHFYIEEKHMDRQKITSLLLLAKQEPDKRAFLKRLKVLAHKIKSGFSGGSQCRVTLSTIHSSKGLEYDSVYLLDVFDGRFPACREHPLFHSKDSSLAGMEERRLFYVGLTRAKNSLALFAIDNLDSSYLDELFPQRTKPPVPKPAPTATVARIQTRSASPKPSAPTPAKKELPPAHAASASKPEPKWIDPHQQKLRKVEKARAETHREYLIQHLPEVDALFTQHESPIRDSEGIHWVECECCGKRMTASDFKTYDEPGRINLGICKLCSQKKPG